MGKKIFKNRIFIFVLGVFIASSISVLAATYFESSAVTYDNTESGLSSTNVQGAIDELYNECSLSMEAEDNIYYVYHEAAPGGTASSITASLVRTDLNGQNQTTLVQIPRSSYSVPIMDSIYVTNNYIYYSYHITRGDNASTPLAWLIRTDLNGQNSTTLVQYPLGNGNPVISDIYVTNNYIFYSYNEESAHASSNTKIAYLIRADLNGQNQTTLLTYTLGDGKPIIDSIFIK